MLPLRWTEYAVAQLEGIVAYISRTSPYRVFYRPYADRIEVLAVVHGRRGSSATPWGRGDGHPR